MHIGGWGYFIICLFVIIVFNVVDFIELYEGVSSFFPIIRSSHNLGHSNSIPFSLIAFMTFPQLAFDLEPSYQAIKIVLLLDGIYAIIYVLTYFAIKKARKKKGKKTYFWGEH